jgi:hypothetical protein
MLAASPQTQAQVVRAAFERQEARKDSYITNDGAIHKLLDVLMGRNLPYTQQDIEYFLRLATNADYWRVATHIVKAVESYKREHPLTGSMKNALQQLQADISVYVSPEKRRLVGLINEVLDISVPGSLQSGEPWADAALQDQSELPEAQRKHWFRLIAHCQTATAAKPSAKWLKEAKPLIDEVGHQTLTAFLQRWLSLFSKQPAQVNEANADVLQGLMWCSTLINVPAVSRAVATVVPACLQSIDQVYDFEHSVGVDQYTVRKTRAPRLATAAIWALSHMDSQEGVAQLARLRTKIRHRVALASIERRLGEVANRMGVSPDELEELATPDFGLQHGVLERNFDGTRLTINSSGGKAIWNWQSPDGETLKAAPAGVKRDYAGDLRELKVTAAEVEKTFAVVKERLDLMLRLEHVWPFEAWNERYFEHELLGSVARRIIWDFEEEGNRTTALWHDGQFVDARGEAIAQPTQNSSVRLWHPINAAAEQIVAWRRFLEESDIRQPFKQAHREIYLLTDAERQTHTYSNRFAAHIIRQHQFNSLCIARGWKNKLRLTVDNEYPPASKEIAHYNLRAEFWIEGIGGEYGIDTNDIGTYLRLVTDQVRFYRTAAPQNRAHASGGGYRTNRSNTPTEPLPLEEIPPLVFSEVMRDVDLFVGVASIGNDPTWIDGGPQGRFVDYWQDYSFGELSQTAQTRRDVLSRLLPRLKIASRCELEGRFLKVRGDLRTYKIHLGSGNILMEPNDQYLCIVPARGSAANAPDDKLFLPFKGDSVLSIVLSKAFLLADDTKITDRSITCQISIP